MINKKPRTHPLSASTNGSESTPEPIAEAQSENMLPLSEPFSSLPKALLKNVFRELWGEKGCLPSRMLMSAVASRLVLGDTASSIRLVMLPASSWRGTLTLAVAHVVRRGLVNTALLLDDEVLGLLRGLVHHKYIIINSRKANMSTLARKVGGRGLELFLQINILIYMVGSCISY